jgi:histidinol-phosphate aminotransferase
MRSVVDLMLRHLVELEGYEAVDPSEALAERAGIPPEKVIRLHVNENPYGPSPRVMKALASFHEYHIYPDPQQRRVRKALAGYVGVDPEWVVAGNGSDELIDLTMRLFLGPGDKVVLPVPTFGMYPFCSALCGAQVVPVPRDEEFQIDVEGIRRAVDERCKLIFIASPNNPTGNIATEAQIRRLLELDIMVVVDETYYEFCGHTVLPLLGEYPNLIVLRTLSKWAGLAGLRIGFGIMRPEIARVMMKIKPPYNVNLAAEVALIASLEDREFLLERVRALIQERERMFSLLKELPGVKPYPSQTNFLLCRLERGDGQRVYEGLARRGIFVRYFGSSGLLRECMRISVGFPEHTDALIGALKELLEG